MKVINKENQFLTGAMYAPFCRTLAAPIEEWEQDIKNMAELGYNCVHGFAEWHDIEYKKGEFDFTLIDHMVDCAHKYGITRWKQILGGDVKIGFTKEMVALSIGYPNQSASKTNVYDDMEEIAENMEGLGI